MKSVFIFSMVAISFLGNACQQRTASDDVSMYALHIHDVPEEIEPVWTEKAMESISFTEHLALAVLEITHLLSGAEPSAYSVILKQREPLLIQTDEVRDNMARRNRFPKN